MKRILAVKRPICVTACMPKSLTTLVPLSLYQKSDVSISVEIDYITNVSKFALNGRNLSFVA